MAQTEKLVYALLANAATITAFTSAHIYPVLLPQGLAAAFPALTYQRISGGRVYSLSGYADLQHCRIQIDCWATSYGTVKELAYTVQTVMVGSNTFKAVIEDRPIDMYDDETEIHRVSMDFSLWHS